MNTEFIMQIAGALTVSAVTVGVGIKVAVGVLGERIDNLKSMLTDINENYTRRSEVEPRFTRIENQVDAIYRDMARLEKKVE